MISLLTAAEYRGALCERGAHSALPDFAKVFYCLLGSCTYDFRRKPQFSEKNTFFFENENFLKNIFQKFMNPWGRN